MQPLLKSTQTKRRQKTFLGGSKKRRGKKVISKYDVFPKNTKPNQKRTRNGKIKSGMSIKRGCQRHFHVKQPYLDNTLCQIVYKRWFHLNKAGEYCHGSATTGTRYSLQANLSVHKKDQLTDLLWLGLSPVQVMSQHRSLVSMLARTNGPVTRDTFVQPHDVRNLARRRAEELWQKHPNETESVKMWKNKNPDMVFFYQEHALLNLNVMKQDDTPFTLGIQTEWQYDMMLKYGNGGMLAIDATFSTSHTAVRYQK